MQSFPSGLIPENKDKFDSFLMHRLQCELRQRIYDLMILGDENDYFDIGSFYRYSRVPIDMRKPLLDSITQELTKLGWKCKTSFSETGLFIYSTDKPPVSCYDDGF